MSSGDGCMYLAETLTTPGPRPGKSWWRLVADQTSVAIENDELTVALRKRERLDRELEIGAEIQLQLLPRQCPAIEGMDLAARCLTAHRVGGDYYDFIPTTF